MDLINILTVPDRVFLQLSLVRPHPWKTLYLQKQKICGPLVNITALSQSRKHDVGMWWTYRLFRSIFFFSLSLSPFTFFAICMYICTYNSHRGRNLRSCSSDIPRAALAVWHECQTKRRDNPLLSTRATIGRFSALIILVECDSFFFFTRGCVMLVVKIVSKTG